MGQQRVDAVESGKAFDISVSERLGTTSGPIVEPACEQHIALGFCVVKHYSDVEATPWRKGTGEAIPGKCAVENRGRSSKGELLPHGARCLS